MIQKEASGRSADEGIFARRVSLRAHYASRARAEEAARAVAGHARTVYLKIGYASPIRPPGLVHAEGLSSVKLSQPHWLAFGAGLALGAAAWQIAFPGLLSSAYIGPATAGNLVEATFILTGLALALGWLVGALVRFWPPPRAAGFELRADVLGSTLGAAEQALRETGAVVVWVLGDESLPVPEPGGRGLVG